MPRWLRFTLLGAVALFVLIQLVPRRVSNPPVKAEPPWDTPRTRQLAVAACFDCHSNQTRLAWFEHVAPVSWWIAGHVDEGRDKLNFSEFDPSRHNSGQRIAHEISEGTMPPAYYTWFGLHGNAKLSTADLDALVHGLETTYGPAVGVTERGRRPGGSVITTV